MATINSVETIKSVIEQYLAVLKANGIRLMKAYLYGSYAKGTADKDSDIDIAVVSPDLSENHFDNQMRLMRLTWEIDTRIEPHPFHPEEFSPDNPEAAEIMKTGIILV